jgi:hypothetical protein
MAAGPGEIADLVVAGGPRAVRPSTDGVVSDA